MVTRLLAAGFAVLVLAPVPAHADEASSPPVTAATASQEAAAPPVTAPIRLPFYVSADVGPGGSSQGVSLGGDLLFRWRYVELGGALSARAKVLEPETLVAASLLVGLGSHGDAVVGGDLLFECGLHEYAGVGAVPADQDGAGGSGTSGARGEIPYLGLRAGLTFHAPHTDQRLLVFVGGVWIIANWDTSQQFVPLSALATGTSATPTQWIQRVGGESEVGLLMRFGFDFQFFGQPPPS